MGKVSVIVESKTYGTRELNEIVKKWFDLVAGDEEGISFTGEGYTQEYNSCSVFIVPSDEE